MSGAETKITAWMFQHFVRICCPYISGPYDNNWEKGIKKFWDHRGSILYNRDKTNQEGYFGGQCEEILTQSRLVWEKTIPVVC